MNPLERWSLHLAALATALTGLGYGWTRYFGQRMGEFGPEPHPLQALFQHAHVMGGPLLVFALGMMVKGHVLPALQGDVTRARRSGIGLTILLAPLILSGYGVQIAVDPRWRQILAWIHGPLAILFLLAYATHAALNWARALRTRPCEGMMETQSSRSSVG